MGETRDHGEECPRFPPQESRPLGPTVPGAGPAIWVETDGAGQRTWRFNATAFFTGHVSSATFHADHRDSELSIILTIFSFYYVKMQIDGFSFTGSSAKATSILSGLVTYLLTFSFFFSYSHQEADIKL